MGCDVQSTLGKVTKEAPQRGYMARPTKYKEDYATQAQVLCAKGFTDLDMAEAFGVSVRTIDNWKEEHEEFLQSIKSGKALADQRVERSLYERATGYEHPEDKIFNNGGEALRVETTKHYPPDATALIFWLKNRKPKEWREKSEVDHNIKTVNVTTNVEYDDD